MPQRSAQQLRADAERIWQAGVAAVDSARLVLDNVALQGDRLRLGTAEIPLEDFDRIVVVGAGKAGAGMAAGIEEALGSELRQNKQLTGWINVPDDCLRETDWITLHPARPAGVNEPTAAGVAGTQRILDLVRSTTDRDLCVCLLSGGGSALLPLPVEGISLADKLAVTQHLSAAGANIQQLNTVRKQLSQIKGGRLASACRAQQLFTFIISDVIGDPLDVIASGPTVADTATPRDALQVLADFKAEQAGIPSAVFDYLNSIADRPRDGTPTGRVRNLIIGNNATAVDAAGVEAERLGYSHAMLAGRALEGSAEAVGLHLAKMALRMKQGPGPDCLITGGEPTVELVGTRERGKGGRNQQLALAALQYLLQQDSESLSGIALLSGGTDGEDGPTDAAGAVVDQILAEEMAARQLDEQHVAESLRRNDAYHFFAPLGGLVITGPTHTNVCDIRVLTISPSNDG